MGTLYLPNWQMQGIYICTRRNVIKYVNHDSTQGIHYMYTREHSTNSVMCILHTYKHARMHTHAHSCTLTHKGEYMPLSVKQHPGVLTKGHHNTLRERVTRQCHTLSPIARTMSLSVCLSLCCPVNGLFRAAIEVGTMPRRSVDLLIIGTKE